MPCQFTSLPLAKAKKALCCEFKGKSVRNRAPVLNAAKPHGGSSIPTRLSFHSPANRLPFQIPKLCRGWGEGNRFVATRARLPPDHARAPTYPRRRDERGRLLPGSTRDAPTSVPRCPNSLCQNPGIGRQPPQPHPILPAGTASLQRHEAAPKTLMEIKGSGTGAGRDTGSVRAGGDALVQRRFASERPGLPASPVRR
jgi:hypothetical protein